MFLNYGCRMKNLFFIVFCLALVSCATSSEVMSDMVGKPIQVAIIRRGNPDNVFDMPNEIRAFQWLISKTRYSASNIHQVGNVYTYGNTATWNSNAQIIGGNPITSNCLYTLYTKWNNEQKTYIISGFEKPPLRCDMPHVR